MPETGYLAVFLIGLLGGTHCVGMCGGIVSALTVRMPGEQRRDWPLHVAYNFGRIASYTAAGAALGALGSAGMLLDGMLPVQLGLYVAANLMLVALGLYLTGFTRALAGVERIGQRLWTRIQPLTRRFLPARSVAQALPLGMLWGFLPCGMVYSVLATALVTGSAGRGALLMLSFGLGTLPNLLLAGLLLRHLREVVRNRSVRLVSGLVVLGFGVYGLLNTSSLGNKLWNGVVCHV
ncbi:MAG TPA: sulfite exporter TauE/SafE family protein [Zoogloea sp.]|uniref:sulfite exporter TauE/SafE family protein n=1 Tax=Zoogloea sp. TaxID=49181 RepID=UPI002CC0BEA1|nr:sulfite exporter TauE/SafE family protein [Zoogloea sp.]HMV16520.1 sulfite exporter TauE/SafE family protein [Rhodocyclaceae bacterium]HMV63601.1 sulfite exporter TauE/SafE family protein [Rhodocyclaceae bacterium]HMW50626.1 sulfite exporter TauE/SafE family protein [Rhodocyclaceae bacterium]HMY48795.1 sulfite exporter TauE/SafE family protein [Rhodocyclaceae bacterium]HMZ75014.1 sulfite exporter TauE/SafE family protein [Rhodocyclaceae bacterium]